MTDIALDVTTGDLDLSSGGLRLVDGAEAIAQNVRIRLRMFQGEWFLDTRVGVPYFQKILGQKLNKAIIDQIYTKALSSTPGVLSVHDFAQTYNAATRQLRISFSCAIDSGAVLVFDEAFIVGGV